MGAISIKEMRINKNSVNINLKDETQLKLNVSVKSKLDTPQDNNNKTVVFHLEVCVKTEDNLLSIETEATFLFQLDEIPQKFTNEFSELCAKQGLEKISDVIDKTLIIMGYKELKIYKNIEFNEK